MLNVKPHIHRENHNKGENQEDIDHCNAKKQHLIVFIFKQDGGGNGQHGNAENYKPHPE